MLRGFLEPSASAVVVLLHAFALEVHDAEVILGGSKALLRGFLEPSTSAVVVLLHAFALVVHEAEVILGGSITFLRGILEPSKSALAKHGVNATQGGKYVSYFCRTFYFFRLFIFHTGFPVFFPLALKKEDFFGNRLFRRSELDDCKKRRRSIYYFKASCIY